MEIASPSQILVGYMVFLVSLMVLEIVLARRWGSYRIISELSDTGGCDGWADKLRNTTKMGSVSFTLLRALLAVSVLSIFVWDYFVETERGYPWLLYFTHWTLCAQCCYHVVGVVTTYLLVFYDDYKIRKMALLLNSALAAIVYAQTFSLTCCFWKFEFPEQHEPFMDYIFNHRMSVLKHGGNFVLALIDFIAVEQPLFLADIAFPLFFMNTWTLFNVVYHLLGGTNAVGMRYTYAANDWLGSPEVAVPISAFSTVVLCPMSFFGFWLVAHSRNKLAVETLIRQKTFHRGNTDNGVSEEAK